MKRLNVNFSERAYLIGGDDIVKVIGVKNGLMLAEAYVKVKRAENEKARVMKEAASYMTFYKNHVYKLHKALLGVKDVLEAVLSQAAEPGRQGGWVSEDALWLESKLATPNYAYASPRYIATTDCLQNWRFLSGYQTLLNKAIGFVCRQVVRGEDDFGKMQLCCADNATASSSAFRFPSDVDEYDDTESDDE
jgi:hypothetical protein